MGGKDGNKGWEQQVRPIIREPEQDRMRFKSWAKVKAANRDPTLESLLHLRSGMCSWDKG